MLYKNKLFALKLQLLKAFITVRREENFVISVISLIYNPIPYIVIDFNWVVLIFVWSITLYECVARKINTYVIFRVNYCNQNNCGVSCKHIFIIIVCQL